MLASPKMRSRLMLSASTRNGVTPGRRVSTCHSPSHAGADPRLSRNPGADTLANTGDDVLGSEGVIKADVNMNYVRDPVFALNPQITGRAANSMINAALVPELFWDGRATGEKLGNPAADQAQGPFLNPKEQALPDSACVVYRACRADYADLIGEVWGGAACGVDWPEGADATCAAGTGLREALPAGDQILVDVAYDQLALSIADYEGSPEVNAFDSKYDLSLAGQAKLTKQERLGFALFQGKGQCKLCHVSSGKNPLFTDYTFDNLGIPKNPENPATIAESTWADPGLGGFLETRDDYAGYAADNLGKHKVPTLRNVALGSDDFVKAYGHNGYFKSLEGIVHFYNTRDVLPVCEGDLTDATEAEALAANCWPAPEVAANVNTAELGDLGLTPAEEAAIVAFLKTLSDGDTP